jgi:hypothetical protein
MQNLTPLTQTKRTASGLAPALTSKQAFELARTHLTRGAQEDYLVWTMIAEFLEAVEKQALRMFN